MTISDEAVEAAAKAAAKDEDASNWHDESEYYRNGWRNRMQVGLEAAAPFIRAEALEELADEMEWVKPESACEDAEACCGSAASCGRMRPSSFVVGTSWLRARAAEMRQGRDAES